MSLRIYTLGHSNRPWEECLRALGAAGIEVLVDVRRHPGSRRHPQFNRARMAEALADAGIGYRWEGEALGGRRPAGARPAHSALGSEVMRGYAEHMEGEAFRAAVERLCALARERRTAILCAERLPEHCHRSLIADYLTLAGVEVRHLLEPEAAVDHRLHPAVRRVGERVVYGSDEQLGLDLGA